MSGQPGFGSPLTWFEGVQSAGHRVSDLGEGDGGVASGLAVPRDREQQPVVVVVRGPGAVALPAGFKVTVYGLGFRV